MPALTLGTNDKPATAASAHSERRNMGRLLGGSRTRQNSVWGLWKPHDFRYKNVSDNRPCASQIADTQSLSNLSECPMCRRSIRYALRRSSKAPFGADG